MYFFYKGFLKFLRNLWMENIINYSIKSASFLKSNYRYYMDYKLFRIMNFVFKFEYEKFINMISSMICIFIFILYITSSVTRNNTSKLICQLASRRMRLTLGVPHCTEAKPISKSILLGVHMCI